MNILEFAKRAEVSTATISRAFHEPDKLRADTRERILALANKLGYYPNPSGRALVRGRHDALGLIWPLEVEGAEAVFAQQMLAALTKHLVAKDLDLLICPVDRQQASTLAHASRTLQRSRCDAWILLYPRPHDSLIDSLKNSHKPVVCLMGELPECPDWKSVRLNQRSWLEDALRRLKVSGSRRVLFFGSRRGEPDHEERLRVFEELVPLIFRNHFHSLPGWPANGTELKRVIVEHSIDGIIGADDRAALMALEVCRELKKAVPKQVRIVGIDDLPQSRFSIPSLSSYQQPLDEMAGCAVELAMGSRQRSRLFEAEFIPRGSLLEK